MDEIVHEAADEHGVTGDNGRVKAGRDADVTSSRERLMQLDHIVGDAGQIHRFANSGAAFAFCQEQELGHEGLRVLDRAANGMDHQECLRAQRGGFGGCHIYCHAHDCERRAELVRGVRDKPLLAGE
jgi:hypothetical protein